MASFKQKNIRKKIMHDDDDDLDQSESKDLSKAKGVPSKKSATLSFGDENDEEDEEFKVKKSKASKQFKKRMQQPADVMSVVAAQQVLSFAAASTTGDYSAESLAALRQQQSFSLPKDSSSTVEDLELAGDEAESLEALTAKLSGKKSDDHFESEEGELESMRLLRKLQAKRAEDENDENKRINMSVKKVLPEFMPLEVGEEGDGEVSWERELLKRSGTRMNSNYDDLYNTTTSNYSRTTSTNTATPLHSLNDLHHQEGSKGGSGLGGGGGSGSGLGLGLGMSDVLMSIRKTVSVLSDSSEAADRRIEMLKTDLNHVLTEEKQLKTVVEEEARRELRGFFADVVGMLRDKQKHIDELQKAALSALQKRSEAKRKRRIREQEDAIYEIKE
eukprot:gene7965-16301_t